MHRLANPPGKEEGGDAAGKSSHLRRRLSLVMYGVIFLYAAAFWIQTGVLPVSDARPTLATLLLLPGLQFLSKKLGADPVLFGYMETVFAVAMLLGGPLFGRFGDLFGARAALLLAFFSSLLTYVTLAFASGIPALFFSRIFAFMMHAMHGMCISLLLLTPNLSPGAQMVMTDVSGAKDRADALGKLGVAYGVGMVVGPPIGGQVYITRGAPLINPTSPLAGYVTIFVSEQWAAAVAAALCVLSMVVVVLFVPRSTKDPARLASSRDSYSEWIQSNQFDHL